MQFLFSLFTMYINCLQLTNAQVEDGNLSRANLVTVSFKELPFNWKLYRQEKNLIASFFFSLGKRKQSGCEFMQ